MSNSTAQLYKTHDYARIQATQGMRCDHQLELHCAVRQLGWGLSYLPPIGYSQSRTNSNRYDVISFIRDFGMSEYKPVSLHTVAGLLAFGVLAVLQCYQLRSRIVGDMVVKKIVFHDEMCHDNDGAKQT